MYHSAEAGTPDGSNNEIALIQLATKTDGITEGEITVLDKAWEDQLQENAGEGSTKGGGKEVDIVKLSAQVQQLTKRISNLEVHVHGANLKFAKQSSIHVDSQDVFKRNPETIETVRKSDALATVDRNLISSRPRNEGIFVQLKNNALLLQRHRFAIFQCLVMLAAIVGLLTVTAIKFVDAHNSVNDDYKPFKVDGKDEYYRNEKLRYELPLHYFWFQFAVSEPDFSTVYNETFNQTCDSKLEVCLDLYLHEILNPNFAMYPTELPTFAPTLSPTVSPTKSPSISPTLSPTRSPVPKGFPPGYYPVWMPPPLVLTTPNVIQIYSMRSNTSIYNSPVSAQCMMTTSEDGTVLTKTVGLRNLTLHLDEIGTTLQDENSEVTNIFGMLIRLEFNDFNESMSGKIMCDLYLEMDRLEEKIGGFATYDILFMVSREEFNSGTAGVTDYIRSMKKVWRNDNELMDQIYSYTFEETTFDGKSEFTAETHLVDENTDEDALLNIEVYPYPTVVNYVSFDRYSYMDWVADTGGYYTIAFGIFFLFSSRITKHANRKDAFQRRQGILPAFSLPHRNAEEISGLRTLVLASLGITEEAYFSRDFDHNFPRKNKRVN